MVNDMRMTNDLAELAERASSEWVTPKFRDAERRILDALYDGVDPDYSFFPFKVIARRSGVPLELVKPLVRLLAKTGEATFMRGLMNEDGEMIGSGYGLTEKGRERAQRYEDEQFAALRARQQGGGE